ncbi:MAG: hypothetical protein E7585_08715 [Ruminococcaceae bacterium]|nr:hypothetical protein [Oscillospiraceae bacterium]
MAKNPELQAALKGKTPEQKKVVKYFLASGCLSGKMKDEEYDAMVLAKLNSLDVKQKALNKIGLDEEELQEIPPVYFHGWEYDGAYKCVGKDGKNRTSKYSATYLFFSDTQVYMYYILFDMVSESKSEKTEEYFYKDITNFSTSNDSVEITTFSGCQGNTPNKKMVETSRFALIVPGDKFYCSTTGIADVDQTISGMKQKLREKKTQ